MMDRQNVEVDVREAVRERYGALARKVLDGEGSSGCCGSDCCGPSLVEGERISTGLYDRAEAETLPVDAVTASLGCGNPVALATLAPGEVVLDLGSGGGIDVLLSAQRVGAEGQVYGLDMTDEMLALARRNAERAGARNVTFLKGDIAAIPLPDDSVDVIISNCVVNLAADKEAVYREAFRVLRPGGRLAISDIVIHGEASPQIFALRDHLAAWTACIGGALTAEQCTQILSESGFEEIDLEIVRRYEAADLPVPEWTADLAGPVVERLAASFTSTFVRAIKPAATSDQTV